MASTTPTTPEVGKTVIVDPVVAKVAGIAAASVPGVHALGGGAARVIGNIRQAVGA
ncbi:Asp23/Gls24 family envelope stress response protein, partial [Mesorhizobium sp. M1A.T.Ca.IN.004.03.1.1]